MGATGASYVVKILWVKTDFLHPTDRGGRIRTLGMIRELHRAHEVHYAALHDPREGEEGPRRAAEYSAKAVPVEYRAVSKASPAFAVQLLQGLASPLPVAVSRWKSEALRGAVEDLLARERYDRLVCDFLFPAASLPDISRAVLFQHNVETAIWRRHAENASNPIRRWFMAGQAARMERFERDVCRRAGYVVAVSDADRDQFRAEFGVERVESVPTGTDLDYFARQPSAPSADLVFVGSMDWLPNEDGVNWFLDEILPGIRAKRPSTTVAIVGRKPSSALRARADADPRLTVTGGVPDVRPYFWGATASIVPLRIGGGTRLKIFEAMAAGAPVVSTRIGAEGLPLENGEHLWLADDPRDFADACLDALENADEARRRVRSAYDLVAGRFSWRAAAAQFAAILERGPRP
jgi:glycosyltransferase involved in cell wall biosynthesis